MKFTAINPATEAVINHYVALSISQTETCIERSHQAYHQWKTTSFQHRRQLMQRLAQLLRQKSEPFAVLMASEMGKPVTQGKIELEKCAWLCEHYAEHAESYLKPVLIPTEMQKSLICYRPLGIVFAIMPWNYPFWQVLRCAVPSLMAANAVILKHAPVSIGAGNAIADLFLEAGFPDGIFQHLILDNETAEKVIADKRICALSFTGSEKAGRITGACAAAHLKRMVLELGGNDPYLVLADADLNLAAQSLVASRLNNAGQVCIAPKRIIAVQEIYDELKMKILALVNGYQTGDPLLPATTLGPLARQDLRDNLHQQVQKSLNMGAELLCGGVIPAGKGFYYPPTLLAGVKSGMPAFDEELFGPVVCLIKAENEREAIELANNSSYGLGSGVYTRDLQRGENIAANHLDAGSSFVNACVSSDPRLPFGGIKNSGTGRELGREGILEFVNTKTVSVK